MLEMKNPIVSTKLFSFLSFCLLAFASAGPLDVALSWAKLQNISFDVNIPWLNFNNETRCFGKLGCLVISKDWYHILHRPFNVFPLSRSTISTKFILYTEDNPTIGHILNAENSTTISSSHFKSNTSTKFIIHGFIDTPLSNWIHEMRTELLAKGKFNIIVVNWAGGSLPLYTQATANTRLVALEIAFLIKTLKAKQKLQFSDVHLIGHSLGAHIAGYVGQQISGIGRITGLDPAEPYFQGMGPLVRLDPSDANFVDVIHTDGKGITVLAVPGYGMTQSCGHLDFYPNSGKEQPGCEKSTLIPLTLIKDGIEEASRVLLACNHIRAVKLFTESINGKCPYIAHRCPTYEHFIAGHCFKCQANNCAEMGFNSDANYRLQFSNISENEISKNKQWKMYGKYFLITGMEYPYCQMQYRVSINLANPKKAELWITGHLSLRVISNKGKVYEIELTKGNVKLEHGSTFQTVIAHKHDFGDNIENIELEWSPDESMFTFRSLCFLWCNDHLYVKSISMVTMKFQNRKKRIRDTDNIFYPKYEYADLGKRATYLFHKK